MPSATRIAKGAALAAAISLACLLPPLVHFVTGPLGPAIGGYFSGSRLRLNPSEAALVGLLFAVFVGVPAPMIMVEISSVHLSTIALLFLSGFAALYFGVLSGT